MYIFFLFTRHNNLLAGSVRSSTESRSNTAKYNTVCRILSSRQFCPYTRGFHHWHMYHDNHRTIPVTSTEKATQKNMDNRSHESTEAHINTKTIHCTNLFVCIIYRVYCSNSCFFGFGICMRSFWKCNIDVTDLNIDTYTLALYLMQKIPDMAHVEIWFVKHIPQIL